MEQRTKEWHTARSGRITGSVAGGILGNSPYMDQESVLRSLVRDYHGADNEFVGGPHIDWGVTNEPTAVAMFELETGHDVKSCGFYPIDDWAGASPDGLVGTDAILECKCPYSRRNGGDFKSIIDQPHYFDQLQMELLATGREKAYFYQWSPHSTKLETVNRDQSWLDENMPVLRAFYDRYLSELDNPEHLEPKRKEINTPRLAQLVAEYDDLLTAIDNATERKAEIMQVMQEAAGFKDALIVGRKLTLVQKAGAVSYAKLVKDLLPNADLKPYTGKPSEYWKFT